MQFTLSELIDPSITIVICSFNYESYVAEAIDSALNQTVKCQVIVVDDGSTDGSRQAIESYGNQITAVFQENSGQLSAYNVGLKLATGDVVMFLDCDDTLHPAAAEKIAREFKAGIVKVHFRLAIMDGSGVRSGVTLPSNLSSGDVFTGMVRHGVLYPSPPGSGNAYRRSALAQLFPIPVDVKDHVGADFFAIYGVVAFGNVGAINETLGCYRVHEQAVGVRACKRQPAQQLTFGNVALARGELERVMKRYQRLRDWLGTKTDGAVRLPAEFLDFSFQKTTYASDVLRVSWTRAVTHNGHSLKRLLDSLWLQPEFSLKKRLGLTIWALLVLVGPRTASIPLARYVCNPASR